MTQTNNKNKSSDIYKRFISEMDNNISNIEEKKDKYYYAFVKRKRLIDEFEEDHIVQQQCIPPPVQKEKININVSINSIADLLKLTKDYPKDLTKEYNINMEVLYNIVEPLTELNNMVGLKFVKENIVDQLLYYLQGLHNTNGVCNDYMHTVISGPPGTGKTEVAKIIGRIFSKIGILSKNKFTKVTRSDLIAGFLGQTAIKTKEVIKNSLGGVLFIDEAYALGSSDKKDMFSKECIDTLCESLSDNKENLMVIIAGYEDELNECFFTYNEGLKSRFTWRFKIDSYTFEELYNIFLKKVTESGWSINGVSKEWFEKKMVYFKYFGRDIDILFSKVKICHSRRVFCSAPDEKTKITLADLDKGFDMYLKNDEIKSRGGNEYRTRLMNTIYI